MFEKCPPRIYNNVNLNNYEPFIDIERCVHIEDIHDYNRYSLSPSRLTRKDQSHLENKIIFVLWFGVSSTPSSHNVYGNVSFVIRLQTLLNEFHNTRKLYYLETVERTDSVLSRLIFTARDINELKPAVNLDITRMGYPLFKDSCGTYYHLKFLPGYKHGHNLEILIDMPKGRLNDAHWLFDNCRKIAVNHEEANSINYKTDKYRVCICYKYNNRQKPCPHPFNEEQTYNHMERAIPSFLDSKKKKSRVVPTSVYGQLPSPPQTSTRILCTSISNSSQRVVPTSVYGQLPSPPPSSTRILSTSISNSSQRYLVSSVKEKRIETNYMTFQPPYPNLPQSLIHPAYQPKPPGGLARPPAAIANTANNSIHTHNSTNRPKPVVAQPVRSSDVIAEGNCPRCRVGYLEEKFTLPGLCCVLQCLPTSILCCLERKKQQCTHCGLHIHV